MGRMFKLVALERKVQYTFSIQNRFYREDVDEGYVPLLFATGEEAQKKADDLMKSGYFSIKIQPRPVIADANWQKRETQRFYTGEYMPVPWDATGWWRGSKPDTMHFAHISIENDARIAYTPDEYYGSQDRQVRIDVGRYLTKYFQYDIDPQEIQKWVCEFSIEYEGLKYDVATSQKDILDVYLNGPNSCMSHKVETHFHTTEGRHPVEAYAGPDLAVAYLTKQKGESGSKFSARAVIWPEKKQYSRVYGDVGRLEGLLRRDGYKHGSLAGARLQRIPLKHRHNNKATFLAPYTDGSELFTDDGQYLVIDPQQGTIIRTASGFAADNRVTCESCGAFQPRTGNTRYSLMDHDGRSAVVCVSCRGDYHNYVRTVSGHRAYREDCVELDGAYYHRRVDMDRIGLCEATNVPCNIDYLCDVWMDGRYHKVHRDWYEDNAKQCRTCGMAVCRKKADSCPVNHPGCINLTEAGKRQLAEAAKAREAAVKQMKDQIVMMAYGNATASTYVGVTGGVPFASLFNR